MTIGTPVLAGTSSFANNTTATTVDIPAGSLVVIWVANFDGDELATGVTDNGPGLTYLPGPQNPATSGVTSSSFWYCENTPFDIPAGTVFTGLAPGVGAFPLGIVSVSGANGGFDQVGLTTDGSAVSSFTVTAANPLSSPIEIAFAAFSAFIGGNTFNTPIGWTDIIAFGHNAGLDMAYQITSTTTPPSWNITSLSPADTVGAVLATFIATPPPPPTVFDVAGYVQNDW